MFSISVFPIQFMKIIKSFIEIILYRMIQLILQPSRISNIWGSIEQIKMEAVSHQVMYWLAITLNKRRQSANIIQPVTNIVKIISTKVILWF